MDIWKRLRLWPRGAAPSAWPSRHPDVHSQSLATELDLSSTLSGGDAREDALRPCLTCRTLLPTTLADTDAPYSRRLTLRGEGTRRVTTTLEISPLAQSFPSAVRLQCSDLTWCLSNTHALPLCKIFTTGGWVSPRTIAVAHFRVNINHHTALRLWRSFGRDLTRSLHLARGVALVCQPGVQE